MGNPSFAIRLQHITVSVPTGKLNLDLLPDNYRQVLVVVVQSASEALHQHLCANAIMTAAQEPEKAMHLEHYDDNGSPVNIAVDDKKDASELESGVSEALEIQERKIRRKIDWRLLPITGALYAVSLIDRLNLPNARLAGMDDALGMSIGNRYSIVTMVFFIGYILCDFPANFVMRKTGPATFLGIIGFLWGCLTIAMGFTKTWVELLICRVIFGALEGGLFPGVIFLLSCWYIRREVQLRFSAFYGVGMVISGLSNLIAYGLSKSDGLGGLRGWSWIFIWGKSPS